VLRKRRLLLFGLALALCGCSLRAGSRAGGSDGVPWTVSLSQDGAVEVAHPEDWRVQEVGHSKLSLITPEGCRLHLVWSERPQPEGLTQADVLDGMHAAAELSCFRAGLECEDTGRRVWMGDGLIWHEIHYRGTPALVCERCRPSYTIELLAYPQGAGRLSASFVCPGVDGLQPEQEQLLLDILNTLVLSRVGAV